MALTRWPDWVIAARWPAPSPVHAITTCRTGPGLSAAPFDRLNLGLTAGGEDNATVEANRALLRVQLDLPSTPCWLKQVHGSEVVHVTDAVPSGVPVADAAVTSARGRVLAVVTADCLPIVLLSRKQPHVAIVHAGWRGLAAAVVERTIQEIACPAQDLLAWLGPAAGPAAYEVGEEVYAAFVDRHPAHVSAFKPTRRGHWHVDLYALAQARLCQAGLERTAIYGYPWCTISDPSRFYSHRRDGRTGRMATLVWIDPAAGDPDIEQN